jgi:hypothetical protein
MVLSLLRAYNAKELRVAQIRRALRAIENYHFTFNVLAGRSSSGGVSALYASRALKLTEAQDTQQRARELDEFVKDLDSKRPADEEFDAGFEALEFTERFTADKRKIQYILRRFHEYETGSAPIDYKKMTIEHVASQSDGGDLTGRIGNLIYISESLNTKLGAKPFPGKKKLMQRAKGEWIPSAILTAEDWSEDEIRARTTAMAVEARTKVWS